VILAQHTRRSRDIALWFWFVQAAEGIIPPPEFDDDGCTSAPDFMFATGEALWPACRAHDYGYSGQHGDPEITRAMVDDWFQANLYICIRFQQAAGEAGWRVLFVPINVVRARYWAHTYAAAVRRLGRRHFRPAALEVV
jgi:hypothetical protein